ncbi:hypothetical protein PROFUN_10826 [Planoprotostelium fungivorum]|uniref:Calponin-homology (CH) domain-containing protein n=1 Tax=Planoprotostelium fungivorum TaxID=1890364 RepID=A0A2P6NCN6_9EUKA|nr:hypothetical protein PROFUN_10826 [Planoprotostelium fungivorum]
MTKAVNSTTSDAVYREDGIQLFGLDAELELKARAKRDPDFEMSLLEWIEETVNDSCTHPLDFAESLKSGVMLCRMINVVSPNSVKKIDERNIPLVMIENINCYLRACWALNVPSSSLFVANDLYTKKNIPQVIANVFTVARLASCRSDWKGPIFQTKAASRELKQEQEEERGEAVEQPPEKSAVTCGALTLRRKNARDLSEGDLQAVVTEIVKGMGQNSIQWIPVHDDRGEEMAEVCIQLKYLTPIQNLKFHPLFVEDDERRKSACIEGEDFSETSSSWSVTNTDKDHICHVVHKIFTRPQDLKAPDLIRISSILHEECNARYLIQELRYQSKQVTTSLLLRSPVQTSFNLRKASFQCLVFVINAMFSGMRHSESVDFVIGKCLMYMGQLYHHVEENGRIRFLREEINHHSVFSSVTFWHDCFLDELYRNYSSHLPVDNPCLLDDDDISDLCSSFMINMLEWKMNAVALETFVLLVVSDDVGVITRPEKFEESISKIRTWSKSQFPAVSASATTSQASLTAIASSSSQSIHRVPTQAKKSIYVSSVVDPISFPEVPLGTTPSIQSTSSMLTEEDKIIKSGNLMYKENHKWKRSYVIMRSDRLLIAKRIGGKIRAEIDLSSCQVTEGDKKAHGIVLKEGELEHHLCAPDEQRYREWMTEINRHSKREEIMRRPVLRLEKSRRQLNLRPTTSEHNPSMSDMRDTVSLRPSKSVTQGLNGGNQATVTSKDRASNLNPRADLLKLCWSRGDTSHPSFSTKTKKGEVMKSSSISLSMKFEWQPVDTQPTAV